jgi:hypothetical protein
MTMNVAHPSCEGVLLKLLRTIRLDPSDTFVFARAAEGGEWAVTGSFLFSGADLEAMDAKERAAFRQGFLGTASLGFATLAIVTEVRPDEREAAIAQLAKGFVERLGAPDMASAREAAADEIAFAASLCDHPVQTLVALHRTMENGEIVERFRTLTPKSEAGLAETGKGAFRAFEFIEVADDGPEEQVDLVGLMKDRPNA